MTTARSNAVLSATILAPLLIMLLGWTGVSAAQKCPVIYTSNRSKPLLFGGLYEGFPCQKNCKPRDDYWGKLCSFNPSLTDPGQLCTAEQKSKAWTFMKGYHKGVALKIQPCDLWPYLRGRTLWVVGDSFSKQLYRALQCFFVDFWDHQECQSHTNGGLVQQLFNLKVQTGESKCIHMHGMTRICMVRTALGQQFTSDPSVPHGGVLQFLQAKFSKPEDIILVNFGIWDRKQGEAGYKAYSQGLEDLVTFYKRTKARFPHLIFRETPADHPKDMAGGICLPYQGLVYGRGFGSVFVERGSRPTGAVKLPSSPGAAMLAGGRLNKEARRILLGKVPLYGRPGYEMSVALYHNHVGMRDGPSLDCLHFCYPGMPQIWVAELFEFLRSGQAGVTPLPAKALKSTHKCVPYNGP